ncbi:MAG: type-F conjugative transfer system secretin TraK [Pseudomonadota bacterium]
MIRTALISCAVVMVAEAYAEQIVEATDGGTVSGYASETGVTRLSFLGDAAASVQMATGGEGAGFSVAHESTTGDLYISLDGTRRHSRVGAASFFVTTRSGATYQIELAAKATPSTQIMVRNPELGRERVDRPVLASQEDEAVVTLIRAMWAGALADGYDISRPTPRERAAGSLRIRPVSTYRGERLIGRVFSVRNPSPGKVAIDEAAFMAPGVIAVTVRGPSKLPAKARARVLVISREAS